MDNISDYFTDILEYHNLTINAFAPMVKGNRKTITTLVRKEYKTVELNTIVNLGKPLEATAIDILQYDRSLDYDRLIPDRKALQRD